MNIAIFAGGALSGAAVMEGDHYLVDGPLFVAGEYPDKDFALSEEELAAAVAGFGAPVAMNHEHGNSVVKAWGEIRRVWQHGKQMRAQYAVPTWLYGLAQKKHATLGVSAEWSRDDKKLVGAAWTENPRIKGNELVAAFSKSEKGTGMDEEQKAELERLRKTAVDAEAKAARLEAENKTLADNAAKFAEDRRTADAKAAYTQLLKDGKTTPAQEGLIVAIFNQALTDDAKDNLKVTFSVGDKKESGGRAALLAAAFAQAPSHGLFQEVIGGDQSAEDLVKRFSAIPSSTQTTPGLEQKDANKPPSAERTAELTAMTPTGQAALAASKNGKG